MLVQPAFYGFMYSLYIGQHGDCHSFKERIQKLVLSPIYALLQQTKLLGGVPLVHKKFEALFRFREPFHLLTLENCFKVQTVVELLFATIPELVIVSTNSNKPEVGWSPLATVTLVVLVLQFVKCMALVTIYSIRRYVDNKADPPMRPRTGASLSKVEMEAFAHMQSYLVDPHDDGADVDGNTATHQLMKLEPDFATFEQTFAAFPHQLFMLNKLG